MKNRTLSLSLCIMLCLVFVNTFAASQKGSGFAQTIARDLVGQVISDPPKTYFPEEWRWTLERGEVLSVDIKKAQKNSQKYAAIIIAHLKRGNLLVNAKMHVRYHYNGKKWVLTDTSVKALNIPKQKDYSQYVSLRMDYDFMPSLMLKNNCDRNLFVRIELLDNNGEYTYSSIIIEPYKEEPVCMICSPQSYRIIYAYQK